jgi:hypothetical protein
LRTRRWGIWQRYRGQTDRGSWTARVIAQLGEAVTVALLSFCCVGTASAGAAIPTPQKAPVSISGQSDQPSPDPAPQSAVRAHVSIPKTTVISPPVVVSSTPTETTPRLVHVVTRPVTTVAASSGGRPATPARPATTHRTRTAPRRPATHHPRSQVTSLAFPLTWPKDLVLLPRARTDSRRDGVLLLLSAVAMGVLALASLSLVRRLRRLELR